MDSDSTRFLKHLMYTLTSLPVVTMHHAEKEFSSLQGNNCIKVTDVDSFSCQICDDLFASKSALYQEDVSGSSLCDDDIPKLFVCLECNESFTSCRDLENHYCDISDTSGATEDDTSVCATTVVQLSPYESKCDKESYQNDEMHHCPSCKKKFYFRILLERHLEEHNSHDKLNNQNVNVTEQVDDDKILFTCTECNTQFEDYHNLKSHAAVHKHKEQFTCSFCKKSFYMKSHLMLHKKVHLSEQTLKDGKLYNESQLHPCLYCDKKYEKLEDLKVHKLSHKVDVTFSCDICCQEFPNKFLWERHTFSHSEDTFTCRICGLVYGKKTALERHVLSHTNARPHSCGV